MYICIVFKFARVLAEMKERNAARKRFPLGSPALPVLVLSPARRPCRPADIIIFPN